MIQLPRLYAIADCGPLASTETVVRFAAELAAAGCTLIQYRNKSGNARLMLQEARELKKVMDSHVSQKRRDMGHPTSEFDPQSQTPQVSEIRQDPLASSEQAMRHRTFHHSGGAPGLAGVARPGNPVRVIMNDRADLCLAADLDGVHVGQDDLSPEAVRKIIGPDRWLGVSTHNPEQLREADRTSADYVAIGPVFATSSKANPDPVVGLEGVRRARQLTKKPLVAIGGITRANAASVIEAGADSVAVISDLLRDPRKAAEEFLRILG